MYGEREEREDGRAYRNQYRSQACDPGVEERVFEWVAFLVLHLYEIEEHYHAHETRYTQERHEPESPSQN